MSESIIECRDLIKIWRSPAGDTAALRGLSLDVQAGESVAVVGASGSGKSTLLSILDGSVRPDSGSALVGGADMSVLTSLEVDLHRRETVGLLPQQGTTILHPHLDLRDNILAPLLHHRGSQSVRDMRERADELLSRVGIEMHAGRRPDQLSGGQRARAALAVVLAAQPKLLLADEPTGELDETASAELLDVLFDLRQTEGLSQLIVTHDPLVAASVDRVVEIRDGRCSIETGRGDSTATVLVDEFGRLQLAPEHLAALGHPTRLTADVDGATVALRSATGPLSGAEERAATLAASPLTAAADNDTSMARTAPAPTATAISASGVTRHYEGVARAVLDGLDLELPAHSMIAIRGASGSGKTTLLNLIGGLDLPDSGRLEVLGVVPADFDDKVRANWRRSELGFVFQSVDLLGWLTARQSIELGSRVAAKGAGARDRSVPIDSVIDALELDDVIERRCDTLSGGQRQRVSLARAIAACPRLLVVDEPTSRLDGALGARVFALLASLTTTTTIVCATHDPGVDRYLDAEVVL